MEFWSFMTGLPVQPGIAKLAPAALVKVEVIGKLKPNHANDPSIGGFI